MAGTDKALAIDLRRQGNSYNEIHRCLGVPKSTLSSWFKNCRLSRAVRKHLMTKNQLPWSEDLIRYNKWRVLQARERSERAVTAAASEIRTLSPRDLKLVGAALYWAEGAKSNRWSLRFSNTDPAMVQLMMRFFREICRVPPKRISARIHLHPHVQEQKAKRFWSRTTGIPLRHFNRSQRAISRSSNGKRPVRRLPYGTLHIDVRNVGVRNCVVGWISGLQQSFKHPS